MGGAKYLARAQRHADSRVKKADTPLKRVAVRFDQWRRRVTQLPARVADEEMAIVTRYLEERIERLTPRERP